MANVVVTATELAEYAYLFVGDPDPMVEGDILLQTRNSTHADGKGILAITNLDAFETARIGAKIWMDGDKLGTLYDLRINNGGTQLPEDTWDKSIDPNQFVKIKPIPGTQIKVERNASTNNGYTILIQDIKYCELNGETQGYEGMRDGINTTFLRGTFGFWSTGGNDLNASHMYSLGVPNGGHFKIIGCEAEHGFSAIRFQGGDYEYIADFTCKRCYLHDGISGEGFYLGATHGLPLAKLRFLNIEDVILARRAAESIQIQHLIDGDTRAVIKNVVIYGGACDWMNAFQPNQDSNMQVSADMGNHAIMNTISDGVKSVGYVTYGSAISAPITEPNTTNPILLHNCLFNNVLGNFAYIHNSTKHGIRWEYDKIYLRNFTNEYFEQTGITPDNYCISQNNGTDTHHFSNIKFDGQVKTSIFQKIDSTFEVLNVEVDESLAGPEYEPQYVMSGFYEPATKLKGNWYPNWGNYYPNTNGTPIIFYVGDIVSNVRDGVSFTFAKCLVEHSSTVSTRPNLRPDLWLTLSWDANGVRNDQVTWNPSLVQSAYPPDNFALKANSYWNLKGMGLCSNEPNTIYQQVQWFRADDASGTNSVPIPGGNILHYKVQEVDKGKWLRIGIHPKAAGAYYPWNYSAWQLVA